LALEESGIMSIPKLHVLVASRHVGCIADEVEKKRKLETALTLPMSMKTAWRATRAGEKRAGSKIKQLRNEQNANTQTFKNIEN